MIIGEFYFFENLQCNTSILRGGTNCLLFVYPYNQWIFLFQIQYHHGTFQFIIIIWSALDNVYHMPLQSTLSTGLLHGCLIYKEWRSALSDKNEAFNLRIVQKMPALSAKNYNQSWYCNEEHQLKTPELEINSCSQFTRSWRGGPGFTLTHYCPVCLFVCSNTSLGLKDQTHEIT